MLTFQQRPLALWLSRHSEGASPWVTLGSPLFSRLQSVNDTNVLTSSGSVEW